MNAAAAAASAGHVDGGRADETAEVLRHVGEWAVELQSFDDFHDALRVRGRALLSRTYGPAGPRDHRVAELPAYLETSFGDPETTAYGPEHELSFAMFLAALFKLGRLTHGDEPYAVNVLFDRYNTKIVVGTVCGRDGRNSCYARMGRGGAEALASRCGSEKIPKKVTSVSSRTRAYVIADNSKTFLLLTVMSRLYL